MKTYTLTPKDLIGLTDHKARYYVIVNNKDPDNWVSHVRQCVNGTQPGLSRRDMGLSRF